jgi:hypothetical protein
VLKRWDEGGRISVETGLKKSFEDYLNEIEEKNMEIVEHFKQICQH